MGHSLGRGAAGASASAFTEVPGSAFTEGSALMGASCTQEQPQPQVVNLQVSSCVTQHLHANRGSVQLQQPIMCRPAQTQQHG